MGYTAVKHTEVADKRGQILKAPGEKRNVAANVARRAEATWATANELRDRLVDREAHKLCT